MSEGMTRRPTRRWAVEFAMATAAGVFLGLLGPFGSFLNGVLWQRIAYWTAMSWGGYAVFGLAGRPVLSRIAPDRNPLWPWLALYTVLLSAPLGLASWLLASAIWPEPGRFSGLTPVVWYLESLTITAGYVALFATLGLRLREPAPAGKPVPPASLLGVPPAEVLCLQMEDHYVRVHTARGSSLVLATFAQAQAALGGAPGLQVHRSWWVADKAVGGAVSDGRNLRLKLTNGLSAPVARSCVAAVRRAGWLERGGAASASDSVVV